MRKLFLVYFVNLYMFRAYLGQVPIFVYIGLYLLMMGLDTPETFRGWKNTLRISYASSCFFLHDYIEMHGQ